MKHTGLDRPNLRGRGASTTCCNSRHGVPATVAASASWCASIARGVCDRFRWSEASGQRPAASELVTAISEPDRFSFRHFFPQSLFQQSEQLRPALANWPQVTDFHRHSQPAAGRPHAMAVDDGVAPHGRSWGRCREVVAPRAGSRGADGRATMLQHGLQAQGQLRVQEVSTARRAVRYGAMSPHSPCV